MEIDCLVLGFVWCWEFIIFRCVCELDSVVIRDVFGSYFFGFLKGKGVWENWFLIFFWVGVVFFCRRLLFLFLCVVVLFFLV